MATVINNPGEGTGSGVGTVAIVIGLIVLIALFFMYGLPALRGGGGSSNDTLDVNVQLPAVGGSSEQSPLAE